MVLTTLQTKAVCVRECHGSGIAFNQVLYTWSPVFKKVQGQESKVPVTKTRDRLLCWQWEAASAAFSRTGFDLGIKAPYSSSTGYLNLDWNQVYRIRVQGSQSLEYCQVVLDVDLAFSRESEWILHQFGLGALPGPFWIWPVLVSLWERGVGQQELSFLRESGRRDSFLPNEVSEY